MDKRTAKRQACFLVSLLIDSALSQGIFTPEDMPEKEQDRLEAGAIELMDEMQHRGWEK